jgi:hypothetical protein
MMTNLKMTQLKESAKMIDVHDAVVDETETRYPEHKKLSLVVEESQAIGEFLDFGLAGQGLVLTEYSEDHLLPTSKSITSILAHYFEIDQDKIDKEKRQMLNELAIMNERKDS